MRLLRVPEAVRTLLAGVRRRIDAAGEAVSHVIAAGILPAAIEMMDALDARGGRGRGRSRATRRAPAPC